MSKKKKKRIPGKKSKITGEKMRRYEFIDEKDGKSVFIELADPDTLYDKNGSHTIVCKNKEQHKIPTGWVNVSSV